MKILIIGGDSRMTMAARSLSDEGHTVYLYANKSDDKRVTTPRDLYQLLPSLDAVILPLPLTRDGEFINTPNTPTEKIAIIELFSRLPQGILLLAGKASAAMKDKAHNLGHRLIDYYESESFTDKNAYITAEGAVRIAMEQSRSTLRDLSHLILGGGRIARHLFLLLRGMGARVTLSARNSHDLRWAELLSADTADLFGDSEKIEEAISNADVIYNTIPEQSIADVFYEKAKPTLLYIELVGDDSLISPTLLRKGIYCNCAKALPAKYAPESAGRLLYETISEILNERVNNQ